MLKNCGRVQLCMGRGGAAITHKYSGRTNESHSSQLRVQSLESTKESSVSPSKYPSKCAGYKTGHTCWLTVFIDLPFFVEQERESSSIKKRFQAKQIKENNQGKGREGKRREQSKGKNRQHRHVPRYVARPKKGSWEGRVLLDDDSSHNFTQYGKTDDWLTDWMNEWIDHRTTGWMWVRQFEYWVPKRGTSPHYPLLPSLRILNIWHKSKGSQDAEATAIGIAFYTLPTPSRRAYRKGCLCSGIPMQGVTGRGEGGERER